MSLYVDIEKSFPDFKLSLQLESENMLSLFSAVQVVEKASHSNASQELKSLIKAA